MATYKVPTNVETEDKLLGPFTLRQLIFVILFVASTWVAYLFFQLVPPLALAMLPFMVFFGVLGFVRRKDQPVEIFLAAATRFYLHPHKRIWDQEGYDQHVIITAPKKVEEKRYRDISQDEVRSRLSKLAGIMDTRGWASKGLKATPSDRLVEAPSALSELEGMIPDMMDEQGGVGRKFEQLIQKSQSETKEEAIRRMRQPRPAPQPPIAQSVQQTPIDEQQYQGVHYVPYPTMHQKVVSPGGQPPATNIVAASAQPTQNQPVPTQPSPDIIRLANNNDRTVSSIAREAHTLPSEEVVISLR